MEIVRITQNGIATTNTKDKTTNYTFITNRNNGQQIKIKEIKGNIKNEK